MRTVPIEFLRESLSYDMETGILLWKVRPRQHFKTERGWNNFNSQFAGKVAGNLATSPRVAGYRFINVGNNYLIGAHRIAMALISGEWPDYVDHINGNRSDNRATNLRSCSKVQNSRNRKMNLNNRSGLKGVSRHLKTSRWYARIQVNKKQIHLGMFDTPEAAHAAYSKAAKQLHGEFAKTN